MSSEAIVSLLWVVGIIYFITNLFTSSFFVSSFYNTTGLETLVIFSLDLTFSYSVLQKKKDLDVYVYAVHCVCLWIDVFVCEHVCLCV